MKKLILTLNSYAAETKNLTWKNFAIDLSEYVKVAEDNMGLMKQYRGEVAQLRAENVNVHGLCKELQKENSILKKECAPNVKALVRNGELHGGAPARLGTERRSPGFPPFEPPYKKKPEGLPVINTDKLKNVRRGVLSEVITVFNDALTHFIDEGLIPRDKMRFRQVREWIKKEVHKVSDAEFLVNAMTTERESFVISIFERAVNMYFRESLGGLVAPAPERVNPRLQRCDTKVWEERTWDTWYYTELGRHPEGTRIERITRGGDSGLGTLERRIVPPNVDIAQYIKWSGGKP